MSATGRRVAISGASGLIGQAASTALTEAGWTGLRLVRGAGEVRSDEISWSPAEGELEPQALEGLDAVIHLSGESIAGGRWTSARKQRILSSRVETTGLVARVLAGLEAPPSVLVCASAVGFYGDRSDTWVDESSPPGEGFLAEVCRAWESAAEPARAAGIRTVHLRTGMVLAEQGGALAQMLPVFRLGLGGKLGSGQQYMSWIALPDVVRALGFVLEREELQGPVNAVAPHPVTNAEFTQVLGCVLGRPTLLSVPGFALRALLGTMADELLLHGQRVRPRKLAEAGFQFTYPELEEALRAVL